MSAQHRPHLKYRRFIRIPSELDKYHGVISFATRSWVAAKQVLDENLDNADLIL